MPRHEFVAIALKPYAFVVICSAHGSLLHRRSGRFTERLQNDPAVLLSAG